MTKQFAYYPGCSNHGSSADYERSTRAVCRVLDIDLRDIDGWNCCGSTPAHAIDTELSAALCVRNLDLAARQQAEMVVTTCPSCLSNLRHAAHRMEDETFRGRVNELLDNPAATELPQSTSFMQAIPMAVSMDELKAKVAKPLKGLKVACYYGCLMSRPAEIMNFGDPENPTLMEELLAACGAEVLDFPLKTVCCGASFGIPERRMTARNSGKILEVATDMGADVVAVACPLCQMNLDLRQLQAMKESNRFLKMPVLYFTQLMGLAFGCSDLGLDKLRISADGLIAKIEAANASEPAPAGDSKDAGGNS